MDCKTLRDGAARCNVSIQYAYVSSSTHTTTFPRTGYPKRAQRDFSNLLQMLVNMLLPAIHFNC
jgi:hypothetical protein